MVTIKTVYYEKSYIIRSFSPDIALRTGKCTGTVSYTHLSSPWKHGKGDVVQELRKACDKYGLKFGVYLSPWDRNAECYGQGEAYNKFFIEQLTELL